MHDALAELIATPPAEFVAVRNRIVAELKAAGDTDAAKRIAKLRRPALVDWALNAVSRDDPDATAAWASAAAQARDAGPAKLKAAIATLRDATVQIARAVGDRAPAGEVAQALTRIAGDADASDAFVAGTLGFALDGGVAPPRSARSASAPRVAKPSKDEERAAAREAARAAAVEAAQRALAEAEAARADAERTLEEAAAELEAARTRAQQAERAHLAARRRLAAAERLVVESTSDLATATRNR